MHLKKTMTTLVPAIRQPGVERRKNHPTRSKDGHMQVLLTHVVPHFGHPGDLVKVKPGFARNYLLPQGLATFATPHNLRIVEKHRQRIRELEEALLGRIPTCSTLGRPDRLCGRSITIEANANAEGHLYGSVNAEQIAAALRSDHFPIDPDHVKIEGPLKETGLYTIKLALGQDVDTEVKLWVVPTHTEETVSLRIDAPPGPKGRAAHRSLAGQRHDLQCVSAHLGTASGERIRPTGLAFFLLMAQAPRWFGTARYDLVQDTRAVGARRGCSRVPSCDLCRAPAASTTGSVGRRNPWGRPPDRSFLLGSHGASPGPCPL